jgi:DNA topoisomerase VI subunit B
MWNYCEYISQIEIIVVGSYGWKIQLRNSDGNDVLDKLVGKSITQTGGRIIQLQLGIQTFSIPIPYATGMKQKNAKVELVSEEMMDKVRYEGHNSVCQYLRNIYHLTDNTEIKFKCRVAMSMTKKMHEKLKEYKSKEEMRNG